VRHLWANGSGKFRTKGRFASAAVRGTEWQTNDRCDGTLITVTKGAVNVFDQTLQKNVVVRAGHRYLAKNPA
jgi:ferric-dicitrate binding protein FerR (iron transport regulator)